MPKEDDLLPKKKTSSTAKPGSKGLSPAAESILRVMRITKLVGIVFGGLVTLVGMMSLVGLVTDNVWARLIVALVFVIGLPAFLSDRILKRIGGGPGRVGDVFAIVLLAAALLLVAVDFASRPLLVREGDRHARAGSRTMARVAYFLGGVSPVFPEDRGAAPTSSGSAAATPDGGAR